MIAIKINSKLNVLSNRKVSSFSNEPIRPEEQTALCSSLKKLNHRIEY
jgi:hypothetical protein